MTRLGRVDIRGGLLIATAASMWGFWPVWARGALGPAQAATVALGVAGILGLPLALRGFRLRVRPRVGWLFVVLLGVSNACNMWFYMRGLGEGATAPAALTHYLAPVLIALAAPSVLKEPRSSQVPLALLLALVGTAVLLIGSGRQPLLPGSAVTKAIVFGSASAVFYAANVLIIKRISHWFTNAELMSYHCVVAAAVLAPMTGLPALSVRWFWPAVGGIVSGLVPGIIYYAGLRHVSAERSGVLTYIEPVAAVLITWAIFGERPSGAAVLGGALVLAGGILVVMERQGRTE